MSEQNIKDQKRDKAICADYKKLKYGDTTTALRAKYNISRSRLYQILNRNNINERFRKAVNK